MKGSVLGIDLRFRCCGRRRWRGGRDVLIRRKGVSPIFYFAGAAAGFARGTGVCFSTWLAVAHSASLAGLFL